MILKINCKVFYTNPTLNLNIAYLQVTRQPLRLDKGLLHLNGVSWKDKNDLFPNSEHFLALIIRKDFSIVDILTYQSENSDKI